MLINLCLSILVFSRCNHIYQYKQKQHLRYLLTMKDCADKLHYSRRIRFACINDAPSMYDIERQTYETHYWSLKSFKSEIESIYSKYLVCEDTSNSKSILGYAGFWIVGDEGHITTMVVSSKSRRNHIADILLYSLILIANQLSIKWLTLEVRVSNIAAINLYTKFGFHQLGIRKNYYHNNNEDALILWTDNINNLNYLTFIKDIVSSYLQNFQITDILGYSTNTL